MLRIVAPNPGPMTLEGTNTYVYGADPCFVIDPGPGDPGHVEAILAAGEERGGIGAFLATHSHDDHIGAAAVLDAEVLVPEGGTEFGGLRALATPGHAADHITFLAPDGVAFCGDLLAGPGRLWSLEIPMAACFSSVSPIRTNRHACRRKASR